MIKLSLIQKTLAVSLTILMVIVAILVKGSFFNTDSTLSIQNENKAIEIVNAKLKEKDASSYLITSPCSVVISGEDEFYFKVEYHEKHDENCPGSEGTFLLLAMYRINKETGVIEIYNITEDKYQILK